MSYNTGNDIDAHIKLIREIKDSQELQKDIKKAITLISKTYKKGGKILFCGNGGSAADAEHLAGEFSGRFLIERPALPAEALHSNSASLTAIANDYGYNKAFARLLESKANKNDVLYLMSTSGQSENIKEVIKEALKMKVKIIALTGRTRVKSYKKADIHIKIPSSETPRIQEAMMLIGHIICGGVEKDLFG